MTSPTGTWKEDFAQERAALSKGQSDDAIHSMVRRALVARLPKGAGTLLDVGCGTGTLARSLAGTYGSYVGCDVVRYDGFPEAASFVPANLNRAPYPVGDGTFDVVACVETIEHLENPRLLMRELVRAVKPGGLVIVTTPNQLSFLSKLTLVLKNEFQAFTGGSYPAHITALVESDLLHIGAECGLTDLEIRYTNTGRIPGTDRHWPSRSPFQGRRFSDNLLMMGTRPS